MARGVDYALREPLDRWMSEWIELARQELGKDFEASYESAAPWLWEGTVKNAVLMPSVDSVGRLFPVLAVCPTTLRTQAIYDTLIAALEEGLKADALRERLGDLEEVDGETDSASSSEWFLPEGAEQLLPRPSAPSSWDSIREHFA